MKNPAEKILCSKTSELPLEWLPEEGCLSLPEEAFLAGLERIEPHWLPRSQAETDDSFKQWIPYVLLRNPRHTLAAYPRGGGETRLHGLWSLGIGGHINPEDIPEESAGPAAILRNGLRRELAEEFPDAVAGRTTFLGLIHESRTPVGRVHIGAVYLHEPDRAEAPPGTELTGLRWLRPGEIGTPEWPLDRFELWSLLSLQLLRSRHPDSVG